MTTSRSDDVARAKPFFKLYQHPAPSAITEGTSVVRSNSFLVAPPRFFVCPASRSCTSTPGRFLCQTRTSPFGGGLGRLSLFRFSHAQKSHPPLPLSSYTNFQGFASSTDRAQPSLLLQYRRRRLHDSSSTRVSQYAKGNVSLPPATAKFAI